MHRVYDSRVTSGDDTANQRSNGRGAWTRRDAIALAVAALVLVVFRLHAFSVPLETDECNYMYIGERLLHGDRLYVDVWDHQPFGVFAMTAGVIAAFGNSPDALRALALVSSLVSLVLIYGLARKTAGFRAGVFGAAMFAVCSSDPGTAGDGCNREIYMNTLVLAAWWLAMGDREASRWRVPAAGVCLSIGSTLKTLLAVHWVALLVWLVIDDRRRGKRYLRTGSTIAWFAAGPVAVWLGACMYFGAAGRFNEFWDAVFVFNLGYSESGESYWLRFLRFFSPPRFTHVFDTALPLWLAGIAATAWTLGKVVRRGDRNHGALFALIGAGFISVCLPARFWPHYYYQLIPALTLAVAAMLAEVVDFPAKAGSRVVRWAPGMLFVLIVLSVEYVGYLRQPPFGITVGRYNSRDFWGKAIGEKIRSVTNPDDSVFVFGNDTEMYYYAQRRCASRFTMISGLDGEGPDVERRRRLLLEDLDKRKPRVLIVLFDQQAFPAWAGYVARNFGQAVGWDCHDRFTSTCDQPSLDQVIMLVFADPDRPIEKIDWSWDRAEVGGWLPD